MQGVLHFAKAGQKQGGGEVEVQFGPEKDTSLVQAYVFPPGEKWGKIFSDMALPERIRFLCLSGLS